jgi:acetyl esterase/lipase
MTRRVTRLHVATVLAILCVGAAIGPTHRLHAQAEIPLWPGGAPDAQGDREEDRPTITPYLPANQQTSAAVIVFPGGGYTRLASDHEGVQPAKWLNSLGIAAFVVRYRLGPRYHHPAMLHDGQRAVRLVRARATEWRVDPNRIGALGFSAGGHMASTVGTHFDSASFDSADPVAHASSRPDLMILVYPVITMNERFAHGGSRKNLLGEQPSAALVKLLSNELQVTHDTPPAFIVASTDDTVVPVENSIAMYSALKAADVPVELHVFESGKHGFGLAPGDPVLSTWVKMCELWLKRRRWVP